MGNNIPPEDLPIRETMGAIRRFGWDAESAEGRHSYCPHAAARRLLLSYVGHRWDKVYSMLSTQQEDKDKDRLYKYIKKHINWFVEFGIRKEGDHLVESDGEKFVPFYHRRVFYVMDDGILKSIEGKKFNYKWYNQEKICIEIDGKNFAKCDSIWYEIIFAPSTLEWKFGYTYQYDILLKRSISYDYARRIYGRATVAVSKRQLNSKEIKKLGLNK